MITLLIAIPVFIACYQGVGMLLDARRTRVTGWREPAANRPQALRDFAGTISRFGLNRMLLENKSFRENLETLLVRSGYVFGWKAEDLLFYKELFVVFAAIYLWLGGVSNPVLWLLCLYLGWLLPQLYVKSKGASRRAEVQRQVPGFIDLCTLALEGGMDLLAAIERIVAKMKPNALREELQTLIQETRLGTPRKEALQHLAFRTDLPDVQSLSSIVIQSEELGTSLATVLRNYAEDMRSRRLLRAEEVAGKAPVRLLLPMMVFFFPIVFVVIFGPLAINFMAGFK